jgi:hypothetical protein
MMFEWGAFMRAFDGFWIVLNFVLEMACLLEKQSDWVAKISKFV